MPGRLNSEMGTDASYGPPMVEDYGTLVELTSSHHVAAFQGIQGAIGLMSFSPSPGPVPGPGGFVHDGGLTEAAGGVKHSVISHVPAGSGSGVAGTVAAHKPKGKLPFTGFSLALEGLISMATISLGLFLRRFTRRRDDGSAPVG